MNDLLEEFRRQRAGVDPLLKEFQERKRLAERRKTVSPWTDVWRGAVSEGAKLGTRALYPSIEGPNPLELARGTASMRDIPTAERDAAIGGVERKLETFYDARPEDTGTAGTVGRTIGMLAALTAATVHPTRALATALPRGSMLANALTSGSRVKRVAGAAAVSLPVDAAVGYATAEPGHRLESTLWNTGGGVVGNALLGAGARAVMPAAGALVGAALDEDEPLRGAAIGAGAGYAGYRGGRYAGRALADAIDVSGGMVESGARGLEARINRDLAPETVVGRDGRNLAQRHQSLRETVLRNRILEGDEPHPEAFTGLPVRTEFDRLQDPHPHFPGLNIGQAIRRARVLENIPPERQTAALPNEVSVDVPRAVEQLRRTASNKQLRKDFGDWSTLSTRLEEAGKTGQAVNRGQLREWIEEDVENAAKAKLAEKGGTPARDRQVLILIGPAASGKSTIADQFRVKFGALEIDADYAKVRIPEYADIGAGGVHVESADNIAHNLTGRLAARGDNLIIPKIGKTLQGLQQLIESFADAGYTVHLDLADLPADIAASRSVKRFVDSGRLVDPHRILTEQADNPARTFAALKGHPDVASYARYNQRLPRETPLDERIVERSGTRAGWSDQPAGRGGAVGEPPRATERPGEVAEQAPGNLEVAPASPPSAGSRISGIDGRDDVVIFSDGREVKTRYRVIDADELQASHDPFSFEVNPKYPEGVQGRAYHGTRGTAARQNVEVNTGKIRPNQLLDAGSRINGPPVITPSGAVVVGNQRGMMLRRAARMAPEAFERYKAALRSKAALFGLDPAAVDGVRNPVLVREIVDEAVDVNDTRALSELNRLSDTPGTKAKDVLSEAATRAGQLRQAEGALRHFAETLEADDTLRDYLETANGRTFVQKLLEDGVIAQQELGRYIDAATNRLTSQGKQLLEDMMYAAAIGDADVVARAPGKILRKLEHAIPSIVRSGGDYDLAPQLREALDLLAASQSTGHARVKAFLEQPDMLGRTWSDEARALAAFLEGANKGQVAKAFREYAEISGAAAKAAATPEDVFGYKPPLPEAPPAARGRLFVNEPAAAPANRPGSLGQAELGVRMMGSIGGAGAGGAAGYRMGLQGEGTPEERRKRALAYALLGAGAGFAVPWLGYNAQGARAYTARETADWLGRKIELAELARVPELRPRGGYIGAAPEYRGKQRRVMELQQEFEYFVGETQKNILSHRGAKVWSLWRDMASAVKRPDASDEVLEAGVDNAIAGGAFAADQRQRLISELKQARDVWQELGGLRSELNTTPAPVSSSGVRFKAVKADGGHTAIEFETPKGDVRALVRRIGEDKLEVTAIGFADDYTTTGALLVESARENKLGLALMRDISREMREMFPDVRVIVAERVGGVRGKRGGEPMRLLLDEKYENITDDILRRVRERTGAIGEQPRAKYEKELSRVETRLRYGRTGLARLNKSEVAELEAKAATLRKLLNIDSGVSAEEMAGRARLGETAEAVENITGEKPLEVSRDRRQLGMFGEEEVPRRIEREPPRELDLFGNRSGAIGVQPQRPVSGAPSPPPSSTRYLLDADVQRVLAANQRSVKDPPKVGFMARVHSAYQGLIDSVHGVKQAGKALGSKRLGVEAQRAAGWQGAAGRRLEDDFLPVLDASKGHEEGVIALADAERGIELIDAGYGKKVAGLDREALARVVEKLGAVPEVRRGADALRTYYRQLLEARHDAGLIDDAQYFALVNNHQSYIPFVRDVEPGGSAMSSSGGALYNRGRGLRQMDAGDVGEEGPKLLDPFRQAVLDTYRLEQMVGKQRVVNVLSQLVEQDPQAASPFLRKLRPGEEAKGGREVQAIVDGRQERYVITDDLLHDALEGLAPESQSAAVALLAKFKKGLQVGVTTMPAFAVANAIRDSFMSSVQYPLQKRATAVGAAVGAGVGATVDDENRVRGAATGAAIGAGVGNWTPHIARTLRAVWEILGDELGEAPSKDFAEFLREGGGGFGFYAKDHADAERIMKELKGEVSWPRSMWDSFQMLNRAIESAPRLARFKYLKAQGVAVPEAVVGARDVSLDFGRRGGDRIVRAAAATTAFWNPKLQGVDKVFRTLNPATPEGKRAWMVGLSAITAPSIALWTVNRDNPEYWSRPQWERNTFWLVPQPGGGFVRIPKPFEVGLLFASLPERMLDYLHKRDPERLAQAMKDMGSTVVEGLVPLPTAVQPLLENTVNYSFFRARPIVSDVLKELPAELQSDGTTSALARKIGAVTRYSPKKIDHLLQSWGGTAAGEVLTQSTKLAKGVGVDERPSSGLERTSQFSRFVTRPDQTSDDELALYRRFDRAEAVLNGARAMAKEGQDARAYIQDHRAELEEYARIKGAREVLAAINTAKRALQARRDLDPGSKKELTLKLSLLAQRVAGAALERGLYGPSDRN